MGSQRPPPLALQMLLACLRGYESSSPRESSLSAISTWGSGVELLRGEAGVRGEVWLRRRCGRGGRELRGEFSGGVETEEDTEDGPEEEEASALRTSAMGLVLETTGERGDLHPWI